MRWPRRYRRRHNPGRRARWLLLIAPFLLVALVLFGLDLAVRPALLTIGGVRCKVMLAQAINAAITEEVVDGVGYRDLVSVTTDADGRVCYMQPDVIKINQMAARAQEVVLREIAKFRGEEIRIPLGTVLGSVLFANAGPRLTVRISPLGSATVNIDEDFRDVGINQVKHTLYITVHADVRVVIPLFSSPVEITTRSPVADVIIVGPVPGTYVRLGR
ncbi:MAG: sporulation protein YunB [Chloroflexota bacterium]